MKKLVMDGDLPFLPQEMITNILIGLPVKSLIRFQCVSKEWENLVKTPSFITDHYHPSCNHNPFLIFDCNGAQCHTLHSCLLDREMQVLELQNAPLIDSLKGARIVDSSNGLLCLEFNNTSHSILLWNPAIREVRQVPKAVNFFEGYDFRVGFGFSSVVNDYKIVRLYGSVVDDLVHQVEVYSLSTGSWNKIAVGNLGGVTLRTADGFTANGAIFWFGVKVGVEEEVANDSHFIISFDIAMEAFTLIPVPILDFNYRVEFTVYEHKLAVLYHTAIGGSESYLIHLWVIEEGTDPSAERWSWTKKYTSNPYPCLLRPMTIWRNEIVCEVDAFPGLIRETEGEMENNVAKIVMCNLTTNEFKMFAIPRCSPSHRILNYAESLIPIGNFRDDKP